MPTPFESASLLLTLYDQRREDKLRQGRDHFFGFAPKTFEEFMGGIYGPHSGLIRMVISYWDMACSFVVNGAIDEKMFLDAAGGEFIIVFGKIEPFLAQARDAFGNAGFAANLEKVTMGMPNARERVDTTMSRINAMLAQRAASQN